MVGKWFLYHILLSQCELKGRFLLEYWKQSSCKWRDECQGDQESISKAKSPNLMGLYLIIELGWPRIQRPWKCWRYKLRGCMLLQNRLWIYITLLFYKTCFVCTKLRFCFLILELVLLMQDKMWVLSPQCWKVTKLPHQQMLVKVICCDLNNRRNWNGSGLCLLDKKRWDE